MNIHFSYLQLIKNYFESDDWDSMFFWSVCISIKCCTMSEHRRHLNIKVVIMNVTSNDKDVSSVRIWAFCKAQFKRIQFPLQNCFHHISAGTELIHVKIMYYVIVIMLCLRHGYSTWWNHPWLWLTGVFQLNLSQSSFMREHPEVPRLNLWWNMHRLLLLVIVAPFWVL